MEKTALILGCGASGLAAAEYLTRRGWSLVVADTRNAPGGLARLRQIAPEARFTGGAMPPELLDGVELVVISPGLSPEHSDAAPLVARARARGTPVVGEIELFARELARLRAETGYEPRVIGITDTNGKTTTTTLVGLMMAGSGVSTHVAGNIGPNAITELLKCEDEKKLPECWVLELSSFQLETTSSLVCDCAAFLNLTQDHIDWHGSLERYAQAKMRIFSEKTIRVLNREDRFTMQAAGESLTETFGEGEPRSPGEWGLSERDGLMWLARIARTSGAESKNRFLREPDPGMELLMPEQALKIRGRHNAMNALAALALTVAAGGSLAAGLKVLTDYRGEAHRVQSVLTVNGIEFIDDSKGTNVGATVAALAGLGRAGVRSSIILGGDAKGQDFGPIAEALKLYASHVVLIGRDAPRIASVLAAQGIPYEECGTDFEKAVDRAFLAAEAGQAVLLSPACASWDMFTSYAERSERFVERARLLAGQQEGGKQEL